MGLRCILALAALTSVVSGASYPDGFDTSVCMPPPNNGGRNFPSFPNDYLARLEWNDHVERKSLYMQEYVSVSNNIGTVYITGVKAPGLTTKYITQADTGELFIIYDAHAGEFQDGNCAVTKIDNTDEFALPFKKDPNFPGADKLLSGKSLLSLGGSPVGNMMFNGTEDMNGIPCDVWVGCLFIASGKITISVTYHFSRNDSDAVWFTAGGSSSAPVGIHAKAKSKDDSSYELEQTFNYAYFSTQWPSTNAEYFSKVFETPIHAYCPGRINTFDLPAVPTHFSFRAEVIDNLADTIMFTKEFYDFESNYTRMDFKSPPTGNDSVDASVSASSIINDFNTGVSYVMDKFTKECVAIPIIGGEFDSMPLTAGKTRIRNPREFFDFDNIGKYPYQYMGEHLVRNVPCNSWISYRPYPNEASPVNATWEWFFATKGTIMKAQDLVEDLEPMRAVIKSSEGNVDIEYNIFRFSENTPDPEAFDVSACYIDAGSTSFEMQLKGNWTQYDAENNIQLLRYWFRLSVQAFSGAEALRIQHIEFVFYDKNVMVRFTLLGPATIKGDVGANIVQVSLKEASDRLTEAFTDGTFTVYFMPDAAHSATFVPVPNTLRVIERKEDPTSYRPKPTRDPLKPTTTTTTQAGRLIVGPGFTSGEATGLAFGVLFLGAILAVAAIIVYRRYTTPGPHTSYLKHQDQE